MARLEGPPPTKEFFIPATGGNESSNIADHTGYLVDHDGDVARIEFMIPHDFHKLVNAHLVFIAKAAVTNMFLKGRMRYGGHGENYETHSHACNAEITTTENTIYRVSVSDGLVAASPLDHVGFSITRPSLGNLHALILGIRVRYV